MNTATEVAQIMEDFAGAVEGEVRAALTNRARTIMEAAVDPDTDPTLLSVWVSGLRKEAASAAMQARTSATARREAADALSELDGVELDSDDFRTRELLRSVAHSGWGWTSELKARVDELRSRIRLDRVGEHTTTALAAALQEMGYDVHDEPAAAAGDEGLFSREDWGPYVVSAVVGDDHQLRLTLVRTDGSCSDPARDHEIEREFCTQLPRVVDGMRKLGIEVSGEQIYDSGGRGLPVNEALARDRPKRHTARTVRRSRR